MFNTLSGLKHVSDDQKTHKNPQLRSQAGSLHAGPKPFSSPRPTATATPARALPPVLELDGKKWKVVSGKNCNSLWELTFLLRRYQFLFCVVCPSPPKIKKKKTKF